MHMPRGGPPNLEQLVRNTIFVSNIPFKVTEEIVAAHFSGCGQVVRVNLFKDGAGMRTGKGIVFFTNRHSVERALSLDKSLILDRAIEVKKGKQEVAVGVWNKPPAIEGLAVPKGGGAGGEGGFKNFRAAAAASAAKAKPQPQPAAVRKWVRPGFVGHDRIDPQDGTFKGKQE